MFVTIFSGIAVISAFLSEILQNAGLSPTQASIANVGVHLTSVVWTLLSSKRPQIGCLVSSRVIDKYGRRPLFLWTSLALGLLNAVVSVLMFLYEKRESVWLGYSVFGVISVFIFLFAVGPDPIGFSMTAELVDQPARASAQVCSTLVLGLT